MPNSLLVLQGEIPGKQYRLTQTDVLIGRVVSNYICLPDLKVSRRHCRISFIDGQFFLDDLQSLNGTFVNDVKVSHVKLNQGDRIRIGSTELVFGVSPVTHSFRFEEQPTIADAMLAGKPAQAFTANRTIPELSEQAPDFSDLKIKSSVVSDTTSLEQEFDESGSRLDGESSFYDDLGEPNQTSRRFLEVDNDLRFLYRASLATGRNADCGLMLREILQLIFDWIAVDRGCVLLKNDIDGAFETKAFLSRSVDKGLDFQVSHTIAEYVRLNEVGILSARVAKSKVFETSTTIDQHNSGDVLCVPILGRTEILGLIYLDTLGGNSSNSCFNEVHLRLLVAIAHQSAVAIENSQYYAELLRKERHDAFDESMEIIAHQIKNKFQGVNGGAHLIETGLRTSDLDLIGKGWSIVIRNHEQISRFVSNILLLTRPYQVNRELADLNKVIQEAIAMLQSQMSAQGWHCDFLPNPSSRPFRFDAVAISSAIKNIFSLCLLAGKIDGTGLITVRLDFLNQHARLTISDNGEPLEDFEWDNSLVNSEIHNNRKFFGIGLAVVRKIIAGLDGSFEVSHPNGQGNRFQVQIPYQL